MKRLLCSTTAISMALWPLPTVPAYAQQLMGDGSVTAIDGSVLCVPTAEAACNPGDYAAQAQAIEQALADAQRAADEAAAAEAQRQADEAAAVEAQRQADEAAAAAEAQRAADEAAAVEAQRAADEAAAAEAQRAADEAAAADAQRAADEAAAADAQIQADEAAAAAEAQRLADDAAAIEAQRLADEAAAVEARRLADEAAAMDTQRLVDESAAIEAQRLADEAAVEAARLAAEASQNAEAQAAADAAAAEAQRLADEASAAEAQRLANEAAAADTQRAADDAATATEAQRLADEAAAATEAQRLADEAAATEAQRLADEAAATEPVVLETVIPEVLQVEVAPDGTETVVMPDVPLAPTVLVDTTVTPDVAPEAIENLGELLAAPAATDDPALVPEVIAAPLLEAAAIPLAPEASQRANPDAPAVLEQLLTAEDTRSSTEEFAARPGVEPGRRRDGLSDLEKVGLVALGAILVGAVLNNGNQVVDNSGDRVVVRSTSGQYYVYKDDDALLRRPGSNVRTETYGDGSTRTIVDRGDGTQVVTIRDATGRVLRRATFDRNGREIVLIDDLFEETRVDVSTLPTPTRARVTISTSGGDAELKAALARVQAAELGRSFSLRQIREIPQVRALAATVEVNAITFDSGSAAITASEAEKLADLGGIINDLIASNPGEIFLIEGHTDAVGTASSNLTLSDRRAESVARALTEYFSVPPENLVVQGYGEGELLIPTTGNERANRRVAVKVISPLMRTAALP